MRRRWSGERARRSSTSKAGAGQAQLLELGPVGGGDARVDLDEEAHRGEPVIGERVVGHSEDHPTGDPHRAARERGPVEKWRLRSPQIHRVVPLPFHRAGVVGCHSSDNGPRRVRTEEWCGSPVRPTLDLLIEASYVEVASGSHRRVRDFANALLTCPYAPRCPLTWVELPCCNLPLHVVVPERRGTLRTQQVVVARHGYFPGVRPWSSRRRRRRPLLWTWCESSFGGC